MHALTSSKINTWIKNEEGKHKKFYKSLRTFKATWTTSGCKSTYDCELQNKGAEAAYPLLTDVRTWNRALTAPPTLRAKKRFI